MQQNIQLGVDYNLNTHDVNASCRYISNILLSVIVVVSLTDKPMLATLVGI